MNKYLTKIAAAYPSQSGMSDHKKELLDTGVIGAIGAGTGVLAHKVLSHPNMAKSLATHGWKVPALVAGGLGLAGDYAAVKINKALDRRNQNKD